MNHKNLILTILLSTSCQLILSSEHDNLTMQAAGVLTAKSPSLRTTAERAAERAEFGYDSSSSYSLPPATQPSAPRTQAVKRPFVAIDADHPETPRSTASSTSSDGSDTDIAQLAAPAAAPHASHLPHGHDCVLCVIGEHTSTLTRLAEVAQQQRRTQHRLKRKLREQARAHETEMSEIARQLLILKNRISHTEPTAALKRPATR